ncbi:hypothetical protein IFM89_010243 [Coptis chinensis]|uniref:Uncharacterized protein n=1 Tax=Coptis chinensis TaxID=261450 RepID=A0A835INS4_9MAGN|nr:hypothetical protein IFM89_010243 [Coptis chinensis]
MKKPTGNLASDHIDLEVERRIATSKAITDAEVEHLLTRLRLLQSGFNSEQLQAPAIQFFKENMPNLIFKINEKDERFELKWKDKDGNLSVSYSAERNMHESLLQQMSKAYPDFAPGVPQGGGFDYSSQAVNTMNLLGAADFQIPDFVMEGPSESQMLGLQNAFQTPGGEQAYSQRLSVGMTPKTLRLPKPGEMLLSVEVLLLVCTRRMAWKQLTKWKRANCFRTLWSVFLKILHLH